MFLVLDAPFLVILLHTRRSLGSCCENVGLRHRELQALDLANLYNEVEASSGDALGLSKQYTTVNGAANFGCFFCHYPNRIPMQHRI